MAIEGISGTASPVSGKTTLVATTPTTELKNIHIPLGTCNKKSASASEMIELVSSRSSAVYVYDVAEQVGFGTLTKSWEGCTPVISLQTRAGAGLSLVGRLSEGTSQDAAKGAVLTAYTTPTGLAAMAQSLLYLPPASANSRLVVQVPAVTSIGETFTLSPTLSPISTTIGLLPNNIVVLLSATPQEAVDLALLSYRLTTSHVIHIFDHHSAARETGHAFVPALPLKEASGLSVADTIRWSGYGFFEYAGDEQAQTVLVFLNGPLAVLAKALARRVNGLGVVVVRVLRPWEGDALREVVPRTVQEVHVFDDVPNETTQGSLFVDVFASLYDPSTPNPVIRGQRTTPATLQKYLSDPSLFSATLLGLAHVTTPAPPPVSTQRKLLFFSKPQSSLSTLPQTVSDTFGKTMPSRLLSVHDVFSKAGGITADRILIGENTHHAIPISGAFPLNTGEADFIGVLDSSLLKSHSVLKYAKHGGSVLVVTPWDSAELLSNLSPDVLALARDRHLRIYTIDAKDSVVAHLAFLRLYLARAATEPLVRRLARDLVQDSSDLAKASARAWADLVQVDIPAAAEDVPPTTLKEFEFNAIAVETDHGTTVVNGATLGSWHDAAKHLLFPSVFTPPLPHTEDTQYPQIPTLRPEVDERTYLVTCTVNRRLTPLEYDRNVFHLEFDSAGTGLTYAIGEALGVHGWNDTDDVRDFIAWYGVDPTRLITLPIGDDGARHTRTVFQALQQQIDVFGQPPKSFYTDLAAYATSSLDKHALLFIGSPEGASTFKKLAEKDTVTYADILRRYPSARPGIETLCEMIGDIKPRHYSIASAQSVVGDRVDLLVVTVDWVTPSGSPRYGQCTRYLAGLKVGDKVTVSIKPSVMKLPPDDMQPIIMAGLGTGAAPFRAFLQHRALLAAQGRPTGPTYYYFGSRHRASEYLYGEEIEAYLAAGTITKAGLAFSRDGRQKVYIQHLMQADASVLADMLRNHAGVFYLCGPTWPVPDVYEALVGALVGQGLDREGAGAFLEGLKEEERYVLEV
ncbi:hypothetical protein BJ138DRAFT_1144025, partial [Hygrophoropsis aurantiaca]